MEKDCLKFREYMQSLTIMQHRQAVRDIMEQCNISKGRIYQWKAGIAKIRPIYKNIICEIAGRDIFA